MNPTEQQLQNRLKATGYTQDQLNQTTQNGQPIISRGKEPAVPTISISSLQNPQTPIQIPQAPETPTIDVGALTQSYLQQFSDPTQKAREQEQMRQENILATLTGQSPTKPELEQQARQQYGVAPLETGVADLTGQLNIAAATGTQLQAQKSQIMDELRQEAKTQGRSVFSGGFAPDVANRTRAIDFQIRTNAIEQLGISAQLAAKQGQLDAANNLVNRAVDLQFSEQERQIAQQKIIVGSVTAAAERGQVALTKAQSAALDEQKRILDQQQKAVEEEKQTRKDISSIMLTARQYGADDATVKRIQSATTLEDAITYAGNALQDPAAKIQLQNLRLDAAIKQQTLAQKQIETQQLQQYGGLTPTEYNKQLQQETADMEKARADVYTTSQTLDKINTILNSGGLSTVVGPNILSRGTARQKGLFSAGVSLLSDIPRAGIGSGLASEVTGSADQVVNLTQQLVSKQFLDNLINVKAQGATFGALTDREGAALRAAATSISEAAIYSGDKVIGYDMSEADFKKEMNSLRNLTQKAYEKASGNVFTPEEQALFDTLSTSTASQIPAAAYF